jgi:hypothetical protein
MPDKIIAVQNLPAPTNLKEIRLLLGLSGFYRKFIHNYAQIVRPLTKLTRKNVNFQWTEIEQAALDKLKMTLTSAPVLV